MAEVTTETKETPKVDPPELPSSASTTTTKGETEQQQPSGYSAVSKSSQSVASTRYNPLTPIQKPPNVVESVQQSEEEKVSEQQTATKQPQVAKPVVPQQPTKRYNKYPTWPPPETQQYLTFHPFGWPIDPEYQYQISNYLGPTPVQNMAQNMAMAQLRAMNPMLAAQAAAVQNPLSLLAAQAAFNPLSKSTPAMPGKQCSLFVFHLPVDIDDHGLLQLFVPFGAMGSNVMRHDSGQSRGFGFVHFNTKHEAQIAIDMMDGHQIGRKRLRVSFKKDDAK